MTNSRKHPGFKAVQSKIAKKYGMKAAGAILASKTRGASEKAKKKNPRVEEGQGKVTDADAGACCSG